MKFFQKLDLLSETFYCPVKLLLKNFQQKQIIEYYQTKEGPEPLQKLKNKIDYEHYIKKQIAPIANTILYFFDKNFEDIMKKSKQTKLFD